jgi:hypothetical protein
MQLKSDVSLFLFCLNDVFIAGNGVLKSPNIIVLLIISAFRLNYICFVYLGGQLFGTDIFAIVISSS